MKDQNAIGAAVGAMINYEWAMDSLACRRIGAVYSQMGGRDRDQ